MRVLVTGATGFIGRALLRRCQGTDLHLVAVGRQNLVASDLQVAEYECLDERAVDADWARLVDGVDCVVHLAGVAHGRAAGSKNRDERDQVNVELPALIARACVERRVKHMVFLSSAAVYGGPAHRDLIGPDTPVNPHTEYGRQKAAAEKKISEIVEETGMLRVSVIRPPMVYGRGAPGNFTRLAGLIRHGLPLPRELHRVRRSFVFSDNLADFIVRCIRTTGSLELTTYLVTDGPTTDLASFITAMSKYTRAPRFWLPMRLCEWLSQVPQLGAKLGPLVSNFEMDHRPAQSAFGWQPPFTWEDGIRLSLQEEA